MSLPYDIARCAGTTAPTCQFCRRKTEPGRPDWQAHISPAWTLNGGYGGGCPNFIEPVATTARAAIKKAEEA